MHSLIPKRYWHSWLIVSVLFSTSFHAVSQENHSIDSLVNLLKLSGQDTSQVYYGIALTKKYWYINLDSSEYYNRSAKKLAIKLNSTKHIGITYNNSGIIRYLRGREKEAIPYYDSALLYFRKINSHKDIADVLNNLGIIYETLREFDKAIDYYNQSLDLRTQLKNEKDIGDSYNNIGLLYYQKGEFANALKYINSSLEIDIKLGDKVSAAMSRLNLATIQKQLGNYESSLKLFHQSLKVFQENKYFQQAGDCYNNIGEVYASLGESSMAIHFHHKAINMYSDVGNNELLNRTYLNIGVAYASKHENDSSDYFLNLSLEGAIKNNYTETLAKVYHAFAQREFNNNNLTQAETLFKKSISTKISIEDYTSVVSDYLNLGNLFLKKSDYTQARHYLSLALTKAKELGLRENLSEIYRSLAQLHQETNDFKKAFSYLEAYRITKDSLLNEDKQKQIVALNLQYESEIKEEQIKLQKSDIERQALVIEGNTLRQNILISAILIVGIILFMAIRTYRERLRTKELINLKNKEYESLRSNFFANISHEFRTPLTLIKGPLEEMMKQNKMDEQAMDRVIRNADRLQRLISQLLDLSKLEAGKMELHKKPTNIYSLLRAIGSSFTVQANQHHIHFDVDIPSENRIVNLDIDKTEKIIYNILSNAFKFTPTNGNVSLIVKPSEEGCFIEVSDSGKGIPEANLNSIFERFNRSWAEGDYQYEGSGIGLALTKELVEILGGTISVKSCVGEGTVFTVFLPMEAAENVFQESTSSPYNTETTSSMLSLPDTENEKGSNSELPMILVVEDNTDMRHYIMSCLGKDYQLLEASNGKQGIELCLEHIPDIIISDLMMPEMDGIEFCKQVRKNKDTAHIAFMMLTARADDASKLESLGLGADDYLIKPFQAEELNLKIKNTINRIKILQDKLRLQLFQEPQESEIMSADASFLFRLRGLIEENISTTELSVESLSREIALSRVQLYRKVQALTGISVNELIRNIRLKKAQQLMDNRWGNVSQIAYEVGFNNLSYFAKCYKATYGKTPSEYLAEKFTEPTQS